MDDIEIYETLNEINFHTQQPKFPYNIQFTQKEILLKTNNGKIFFAATKEPENKIKSSGGVRIYF
jgi:hypothetical protein